jgi:Holliday junction resolvase|tara:strand:+ start:808 stop:1128 length:321 start_codon:yes stop_codon:yes gene_type:complete
MAHPSKVKGNKFERDVVNKAKEFGLESKRAYASNGESLGMHAEVDLIIEDYKIQAKIRKSIASYLVPNENVDAQVIREDRGEAYIVLRLEDWLEFISGNSNNNVGS